MFYHNLITVTCCYLTLVRNSAIKFKNNCVRFIFGLKKFDHITQHFKSLKTLNMANRRNLHCLTMMHKIVNNKAPKYLCNKIKCNANIHTYRTRGRDRLITSKANNNYGLNSFFNKIALNYNTMLDSLNIKKKCSNITFKNKCKSYLLQRQMADQHSL